MFKLIVLLIVVAVVVIARKAKPAEEKSGHGFEGQLDTSYQPEYLKVASYNIQTGKSEQGKRDLMASAEVISKADLVGVQEVYGIGFDGLFNPNQAERLAEHGLSLIHI